MTEKTARPSFTQVMTPEGTLIWPKLDAPDEYKGKKSYTAKIRLSAEDSEALIAKIEAALQAHWPVAKAEYQSKIDEAMAMTDKAKKGPALAKAKLALAEMKEADKSYKPAYNDEGDETGEYEFNFKMPDHFVNKAKKAVFIKPDVFDAAGVQLKVVPEVWGGTRASVAGELRPFSMPIGVGISLRLKAVQIIELAGKGSGGRSASAYGFGAQEGFSAKDVAPEADDEDGPPAGHPASAPDDF